MSVQVIKEPRDMIAWADAARGRGERIAFVPTLGYLHAGHVALLSEARRRGDRVVLSIFVNPAQFAPGEDLARYPRDPQGDLDKATGAGVDVMFVPDAAAMYEAGYQTFVQVRELEQGLCGDLRPGHFIGVATVVCKLFNIVRPHVAVFGEKDFQQLAIVRRMTRDLTLGVEVASLPTVREADGLALSSRNSYLSPADRKRAAGIYAGLCAARLRFAGGERRARALFETARDHIEPHVDRIEYVELRDAETLGPVVDTVDREVVILVAAHLGGTRLIDNIQIR